MWGIPQESGNVDFLGNPEILTPRNGKKHLCVKAYQGLTSWTQDSGVVTGIRV